jgi:non-ribosomal peptide synthetase component F
MRDSFRAATSKLAELAAENVGTPCVYTLLEAAGGMIAGGESERAPVDGTKTDPQTKAIPAPRGTTAKPAAASAPERKAPHRSLQRQAHASRATVHVSRGDRVGE